MIVNFNFIMKILSRVCHLCLFIMILSNDDLIVGI